jgi:TolA-binding protein
MKNAHWLFALLAMFAGAATIRAQAFSAFPPAGLTSLTPLPGLGFPCWKRPYAYSAYWGTPISGNGFANPYLPLPVTRVSYFGLASPAMVSPQPVVVVSPRPRITDQEMQLILDLELLPKRTRQPAAEPQIAPEPLIRGIPASVFRPIRPIDRLQALQPAMPMAPKRQEAAAPGKKKLAAQPQPHALREPGPLPGIPLPMTKPKNEHAMRIKLGQGALADGEYGRAELRFRQAIEAAPDRPLPHFLLAQAQFALGKYQEAVLSIQSGMQLQPHWPSAYYRPRRQYGANADWPEQLQRLANVLTTYPDDSFLLFLYAYQLWFDDRQAEARSFFTRARALAPDPSFSERFLRPLPMIPFILW